MTIVKTARKSQNWSLVYSTYWVQGSYVFVQWMDSSCGRRKVPTKSDSLVNANRQCLWPERVWLEKDIHDRQMVMAWRELCCTSGYRCWEQNPLAILNQDLWGVRPRNMHFPSPYSTGYLDTAIVENYSKKRKFPRPGLNLVLSGYVERQ